MIASSKFFQNYGNDIAGGGGSGGYGAGLAGAGLAAGLIGALSGLIDQIGNNNTTGNKNNGFEDIVVEQPKPEIETIPNETITQTPERDHILSNMDGINATEGETIKPIPPTTPDIDEPDEPDVPDKTEENIEYSIDFQNYKDFLLEQQERQWAREDAIRAETQAREDNAYQRSVEDMLKAGINPNLMGNISPAASGGGITQATGLDMTILGKQIDAESQMLLKLIEQNWKGDQNTYDRIEGYISSVLQLAGQIGMGLLISKAKK